MGIGVSYTGYDGRQRHFEAADGADAKRLLSDLMPDAKRHTGDALREAMSRLPGMQQKTGGKMGPKVMTGGSVVEARDGSLCLRGEENTPLVEGVRMFSSVNGQKGFHSIEEIDPKTGGAVCGPMFGTDSVDEDTNETTGGEAVRIPFVSRNYLEHQKVGSQVTVYEFIREMLFTANGRFIGCTKERRRIVGSFIAGGEGGESSGGGKYCVRPVFGGGGLSALLFGTESQLDSGSPASVVNTTTCPNAGGSS